MNMFPSTSSIPQEIIENVHYSRRLLLQPTTTPQTPAPTYQVLDPDGSSHGSTFDANIVMILAVLICALIGSLCINTLIRCVIKCSSLLTGEPNYSLNMINHEKNKSRGLDKGALKTFPMVKYSKEVKIIQGLSNNECVICLLEFKCGEKVRVLPICNHGFHAKCIDKWLSSHSSCPTCRQSLVETCKKIIGCGDDHHHEISSSISSSSLSSSSSSSSSTSSREVNTISIIVPLEIEDLERN